MTLRPVVENNSLKNQYSVECLWNPSNHMIPDVFGPEPLDSTYIIQLDMVLVLENSQTINLSTEFYLCYKKKNLKNSMTQSILKTKKLYSDLPNWAQTGLEFTASCVFSAVTGL